VVLFGAQAVNVYDHCCKLFLISKSIMARSTIACLRRKADPGTLEFWRELVDQEIIPDSDDDV
jgi:N-acetyl-anhydromuramyl-L-alanine amidase AmpD